MQAKDIVMQQCLGAPSHAAGWAPKVGAFYFDRFRHAGMIQGMLTPVLQAVTF